ncbi:hypothetical protein CROQUDRAFT_666074 [Cronartium quercuum f. sp. fusiforme G11]|uniref:Uncharacterized protein n=1 Tax=Cronartium quercuum f. sp. fusiforme G11 TaxID=708437 RepID=A0A9P6N9J3_9BASI|nr:hypothetical protein CROQUDRAFT_666074 [Cronartium quercuum f. sp. fusiforme G11]
MVKPADPAVIAAQEAGVAKMMQTMPRPLIDGQPAPRDFEDVEDLTKINQCIARISRKGVMDVRYDHHTKVYLIPDDLT